jgi:hypothetical protein
MARHGDGRVSVPVCLVHEFFEPAGEALVDFLDFLTVVLVEAFLLEVEFVALEDELFEAVEDVLLDEAEVAGEFLVVDVLLDFVVEADPLAQPTLTKFL